MSKYALRLPDSLYEAARRLARADGISLNQFIATAVAEKVSALDTADYLARRGQDADLDAYRRVLERVPDATPVVGDELPDGSPASRDDA
jgi:hypothetical protein